ncbi:MAG: stage V sporulation protein AB [Clostridiales bacterium]|jgi:stage V sporulation protein AB|nr:stage V sporulation protein AB [Clostridiales bacterium]
MRVIKTILVILLGFGSGAVISGAVFAFISVLGVIPRLAGKTGTEKSIHIYEQAIVIGGVFGTVWGFFEFPVPIPKVLGIVIAFCVGIFYGCMAVSISEVINVIPILTRRMRLEQGLFLFILAIAIGKLAGSLAYYVVPGFFLPD